MHNNNTSLVFELLNKKIGISIKLSKINTFIKSYNILILEFSQLFEII